jgi:exopolyphosphatase/guanosine-5'-triphosphate,3'-diphosphate pyrophosphatase
MAPAPPTERNLAAIDVGTNAVRLRVVRIGPAGNRQSIVSERDAVRPGEGVYAHSVLAEENIARLIPVLRRYKALVEEYDAKMRAVATASFRDAQNAEEAVARIEAESGVRLEVISGLEEARLESLGALQGAQQGDQNLIIDIGGGSTEVGFAVGDEPAALWSLGGLGALRITDHFGRRPKLSAKDLTLMRRYALRACEADLPRDPDDLPTFALGTSGSLRSLIAFASSDKSRAEPTATHAEIRHALAVLARMSLEDRLAHFEPHRAEVIVGAAAILDAIMEQLKVKTIQARRGGLRDGIIVDLIRRSHREPLEAAIRESAMALGERFTFDPVHAKQVAKLAVKLFDDLKMVHTQSRRYRILLEVAALLHDVGYAINRQRHHRHSQYIIENADIAGLTERERLLVSRLSRYHRRTPPKKGHAGLSGLGKDEVKIIQQLAPLLRIADALDRSHHDMVDDVSATSDHEGINLVVQAKRGAPLEAWDAQREAPVVTQFYDRQLTIEVRRPGAVLTGEGAPAATSDSAAGAAEVH